MTVKGIDVSSVQGPNFSTSGLDFCFIKATEGHTYISPSQAAQAAKARAAGLVVGFYHFLWPGNITEQAAYFVEKCLSVEGDLLICDWETTSAGTHASGAEKDAYMKEVKRLRPDHKSLLYCSTSAWKSWDTTSYAGDGLWAAEYGVPAGKPNIQADFLFHQYTDAPLDQSVGEFADKAALRAWAAGGTAVTPPAKPEPSTAKPAVVLANVVAAAKKDPSAAQGHTTHKTDVQVVEKALQAEGLLASAYVGDGSFGSKTVTAYASWQRKCGFSGKDADGIPGKATLAKLGAKHGFSVK